MKWALIVAWYGLWNPHGHMPPQQFATFDTLDECATDMRVMADGWLAYFARNPQLSRARKVVQWPPDLLMETDVGTEEVISTNGADFFVRVSCKPK